MIKNDAALVGAEKINNLSAARSVDIVKAVVNESCSERMKELITDVTAENLKELAMEMVDLKWPMNEFIPALINRVGLVIVRSKTYINRLKMLRAGRLEIGDVVEEIAYDLIAAKDDYLAESGVDDVFTVSRPQVYSALHRINYQQKFKVSRRIEEIKKAFVNEGSLSGFLEGIITTLYNSFEQSEYLAYINLIRESATQGYMRVLKSSAVSDDQTGKTMIQLVKTNSTKMTFMSCAYTKAGNITFADREDLYIILDAETDAAIETQTISGAFQADALNFINSGRKIVVDSFGLPGVHAVIADRSLFQIYENQINLDSIYNPSNQTWNFFLHAWEVITASPFAPAFIIADSSAGSISTITIDPATATVNKGTSAVFKVETTGSGVYGRGATYRVTGQTGSTTITEDGILHVGADETATSLTVTATSDWDSTKTATATVTVPA